MSGQFRDSQVIFGCIDDYASSTHYYFTVKRGKGGAQIPAEQSFDGLRKKMAGCRRGGHTWAGEWEFK
jgi:hypothetical protein